MHVGRGENAGKQRLHLFPQCFQKASFQESLKVGIVWLRVRKQQLTKQQKRFIQIKSICRRQIKCS